MKWLKTTIRNKKLPKDSLLTNEEIERLVRAADNPRDRSIVWVLAESGIRIGELLSLHIGDIRFDKYSAIITVSGKTGDRAVRLVAAPGSVAPRSRVACRGHWLLRRVHPRGLREISPAHRLSYVGR